MRIMILNTKGGVGKSTVAQQVFCPFLYEKEGGKKKIRLIEIDEQNWDGAIFKNSNVIDWKGYKLIEMDKLISEITRNRNLVVDTGGNITGERCLQEFAERGYIDMIDLFVVPLGAGEQDAVNAVNTYKAIKEKREDAEVIFVLSQVLDPDDKAVELQFWAWAKAKQDIPEVKQIKVPASPTVGQSRKYGMTVYEIAKFNTKEITQKMADAVEKGDDKKAYEYSLKLYLVNKSKQWWKFVLNQLEKVL